MILLREPIPPLLFQGTDIRRLLEQTRLQCEKWLRSLRVDQLDDGLVSVALQRHGVAVPKFCIDQTTIVHEKTDIDARRFPEKVASVYSRGPVMIPGWSVTVRVPFEGESAFFKASLPKGNLNPPRAVVLEDAVEFHYEMETIEATQLKARYQADLQSIQEWLTSHDEAVGGFNESLTALVRNVLAAEKRRHEEADAELAKVGVIIRPEDIPSAPETRSENAGSGRSDPPRASRLSRGEDPSYTLEGAQWLRPIPKIKDADGGDEDALLESIEVLVITAVDVERDAVLREMRAPRNARSVRRLHVKKQTFYVGRIGAYSVGLTSCRMGSGGRDGSPLSVADAIDVCRPACVIAVGIAFGGDTSKLSIEDVLVSSQVIPYEAQRKGDEKTVYRGARPEAGSLLLNRFSESMGWSFRRPDGKDLERVVGPTLAGEKLVDSLEFKAELFSQFPDAIGGEMEGSGLYAGATRRDLHEWIVVKAVCDWADGTKTKAHQPLAAAAAASLVAHVLSSETSLSAIIEPQP
jgi:nucleoside phosphorylase